MVDLSQFKAQPTDWRAQLQKNKRKTRAVVITFIALYVLLGLLVDTFIYQQRYFVPTSQIIQALLTLQLVPYATLITTAIAILSIVIAYTFYDRIMLMGTQYREITPESAQDLSEKQLYNTVEEMKIAANLPYMPKVYLIQADYMNAFASGYSQKSALVAVTRGLLAQLDRSELKAVIAHELSHIRHLDIKLTLTVTVLSNIMLIIIDIMFYRVLFSGRRRQGSGGLIIAIMLLRYLLPLITVLLSLYLSRTREYMADAGCVELMRDNEPLARALLKIDQNHQENKSQYRQAYNQTAHEEVRRAAYLYDPVRAGIKTTNGLSSAFSTHPSLTDRLKALGFTVKK